jgi:multicomponent Na+:H+ antiporter subunit D
VLSSFTVIPLAVLVLVNLPLGGGLRRSAWGLALALTALQVAVVSFAPGFLAPGTGSPASFLAFRLTADGISRVLLLTIGIVCFAVLLVAREMVVDVRQRANFVNVLLVALIGMNGTVLLADVFSLYVFLEITSVASLILIASNRDRNALEGAFKYLILSVVATVLMLTGVALLLLFAGGTSFDEVRRGLTAAGSGYVLARAGVGALVCGLFIKGGLVPFHAWVPDAYASAPAPVSVLLAGIATKASGVYALVRLVTGVFPATAALNEGLLLVGALSVVVGALAALGQSDMKRMLAYSSISQVGYILLGLGCGTALGLAGAVLHLFNHAMFKALLFVNAGAWARGCLSRA